MLGNAADLTTIVTIVTFLVFLLANFILVILFFYRKRQAVYQGHLDKIKSEHEKEMLKVQLEIQESTCGDISREIHDNIGLTLTLAKLKLNSMNYSPETLVHQVEVTDAVELIGKAITDLNNLSKWLKSEMVLELGFLKSIEFQLQKIEGLGLFKISTSIVGEPYHLDCKTELILYRIFQEAVTNTIKHSKATELEILINYGSTSYCIQIKDNGVGFTDEELFANKITRNGSGISNIHKRMDVIAGVAQITSSKNIGTTILLTIPKT